VKLESILNEIKQVAVQTELNYFKQSVTKVTSYRRIEAMIGGLAMHRKKETPMA
jgi:hypothetical protein